MQIVSEGGSFYNWGLREITESHLCSPRPQWGGRASRQPRLEGVRFSPFFFYLAFETIFVPTFRMPTAQFHPRNYSSIRLFTCVFRVAYFGVCFLCPCRGGAKIDGGPASPLTGAVT